MLLNRFDKAVAHATSCRFVNIVRRAQVEESQSQHPTNL
jgi:hypothetical protein